MDSFELNKVIAAVLVALLAVKIFDIVGNNVVSPVTKLSKNVLMVTIPESTTNTIQVEKELGPITPFLATASAEKGGKYFKKCMQCHVIEKGKSPTIGPNLWGVVGRAIASMADYSYSSALKEKAPAVWDVETINKFIHSPRKFVSGTKMTFLGVESDQERADIITYLQKVAH